MLIKYFLLIFFICNIFIILYTILENEIFYIKVVLHSLEKIRFIKKNACQNYNWSILVMSLISPFELVNFFM